MAVVETAEMGHPAQARGPSSSSRIGIQPALILFCSMAAINVVHRTFRAARSRFAKGCRRHGVARSSRCDDLPLAHLGLAERLRSRKATLRAKDVDPVFPTTVTAQNRVRDLFDAGLAHRVVVRTQTAR